MKKTAVILFNLGGPDSLVTVQPFLFNLFNDKAIIRVPQPFRFFIAKMISARRAPIACAIYAQMGGASPILSNTKKQALALEKLLNDKENIEHHKVFIAMRYWGSFAQDVAQDVKNFAPDAIILLPLYPQFSTTTTGSSLKEWRQAANKINLTAPTKEICCYPQESGFIGAMAASVRSAYDRAKQFGKPRVLFSAHGLPEKIIKAGDPYAAHCALTVEALRGELKIENLESVLCFQSRVGPLKWIGPSTDEEIRRAGRDKMPLVVAPIAFVSDHSETLVEIDIEYRQLATKSGVPHFAFVPAVGTDSLFIEGLARMVRGCTLGEGTCLSASGARICAPEFSDCLCHERKRG